MLTNTLNHCGEPDPGMRYITLIKKDHLGNLFQSRYITPRFKPFSYEVYSHIFQEAALTQKEKAFEEFKHKNYERSLTLFHLALLLHPQGNSNWMKFKRSIESHQADASFKLQRYVQALEIGEQSYQSNSTVNAVRNVVPLCLSSYLVQSYLNTGASILPALPIFLMLQK